MPQFKYEEISDYLHNGIKNGNILPGEKLPSLRLMSRHFECAISVVIQAYQELELQGFARAVEKSGYFAQFPETGPIPDDYPSGKSMSEPESPSIIGRIIDASNNPEIVPLGAGMPVPELLPVKSLSRSIRSVSRDNPRLFSSYTHHEGSPSLRQEIAKLLITRGINVTPDAILITNGCTEALTLAIQATTEPGDPVAIESPVYLGMIQILSQLKRKVIPVATSVEHGIDVDRLEVLFREKKVKACVISPANQNPLGFVMPRENRQRMSHLASRYHIPIIEDDIYSDCSFEGTLHQPVKAFSCKKENEDNILYCSSVSKTISPGLRTGWLIAGKYMDRCITQKMSLSLGNSPILQEGLADFFRSSAYNYHVRRMQKMITQQCLMMRQLLARYMPEGTAISQPRGGYFLWLQLPSQIDSLTIFEKALRQGISTVPGPAFSPSGDFRNYMRISCAAPITEKITGAVKTLGDIIRGS